MKKAPGIDPSDPLSAFDLRNLLRPPRWPLAQPHVILLSYVTSMRPAMQPRA